MGELRSLLGGTAVWECGMKALKKDEIIPDEMHKEVHHYVTEHSSWDARSEVGMKLESRVRVGRIRAFIIDELIFHS